MKTHRGVVWIACLLLGTMAGAAGCRMARMAVNDGLRDRTEEWPVDGRQRSGFRERVTFGPYRVTEIRRGWRNNTAWTTYGYRSAQARQRFEFVIHSGEEAPLVAHAATSVRWQDVSGKFGGGTGTLEIDSETVFACTFDREAEPTWFLAMSQGTQDIVLSGALVCGDRVVRVRGTQTLEGTSMPLLSPAGYTFHDGGRMIAAVEVINRGAVWFAPEMDPALRDPVAAATAALLLYRSID